jgi:hypothetical protein
VTQAKANTTPPEAKPPENIQAPHTITISAQDTISTITPTIPTVQTNTRSVIIQTTVQEANNNVVSTISEALQKSIPQKTQTPKTAAGSKNAGMSP